MQSLVLMSRMKESKKSTCFGKIRNFAINTYITCTKFAANLHE